MSQLPSQPAVGVLARTRALHDTLSAAERVVADTIEQDPQLVVTSTIGEMARACGVAQPTLSRFARTVGFDSYPQLRLAVARDLATSESRVEDQPYAELTRTGAAVQSDPATARMAARLLGAGAVEIWPSVELAESAALLAARLRAAGVRAAATPWPSHWLGIARALPPDGVILLLSDRREDPVWTLGLASTAGHPVIAIATGAPPGVDVADILLVPPGLPTGHLGTAVGDAVMAAVARFPPSPPPTRRRDRARHS